MRDPSRLEAEDFVLLDNIQDLRLGQWSVSNGAMTKMLDIVYLAGHCPTFDRFSLVYLLTNANRRYPSTFPEILETILSHVNHNILRWSVTFVCRQWFLMSKVRPLCQVAWDSQWGTKLEPVLVTVPGAGNGPPKHCRLFYTSLRELDLRLDFFEDDQLDCIDFPSSLTNLKLDLCNSGIKTMHLGVVLNSCRLLEVLHAGRVDDFRIVGLSFNSSQKPLTLRSLVFRNVAYLQPELKDLLRNTPRLQELKFIGLQSKSRSHQDRFTDMELDQYDLFQYIRMLGLTIDNSHFSIAERYSTETEWHQRLNEHPRDSTEW
ncbi:hypothetical protein BGZ47_009835 [Haplosporangium gracile]|nr:hypothetical protein BGZ47_009835 [Haplosporangium gracile]